MLGEAKSEAGLQQRISLNTPTSLDVILGQFIGSGSFGRVYHGKWKGAPVAVKILKHLGLGSASNDKVSNEAMIARHAIHPNIVPLFDKLTRHVLVPELNMEAPTGEQCETLLIMELCDKGSLDDRLQRLWNLRQGSRRTWLLTVFACLLDVVFGMEYLHSIGICHGNGAGFVLVGDLKPANILCKASSRNGRGYICKICDFGLASTFDILGAAVTTGKGALLYASPARLGGDSISQEDDVYSFGILAWHLLDGDSPQADMPQLQLIHQVLSNGWRPDFTREVPDDFKAMVESAWANNPAERPSFLQLRNTMTEIISAHSVKS